MERLDYESGETTPALSDVEQGKSKKRVTFTEFPGYDAREQKRKEVSERIKKKHEQADCSFTFIFNCCLVCMIIVIIFSIIIICKYYSDALEHRNNVDNKIVIVSEKWIDYNIHEQVNCTNTNPCKEWSCSYVLEHFHKTPDECEYNDYLVPVFITNIVFVVCVICQCIFN